MVACLRAACLLALVAAAAAGEETPKPPRAAVKKAPSDEGKPKLGGAALLASQGSLGSLGLVGQASKLYAAAMPYLTNPLKLSVSSRPHCAFTTSRAHIMPVV